MTEDVTAKNISLKVEIEQVSTQNGKVDRKVVKHNGKIWTVGKKGRDKVEVGKSYNFDLEKSEYNDKIYYWANLVESETNSNTGDGSTSASDEKTVKSNFMTWFDSQSQNKKIEVITVLLGHLKQEF